MDPLNLAVNRHLITESQRRRLFGDEVPPDLPTPGPLRRLATWTRRTFRRARPPRQDRPDCHACTTRDVEGQRCQTQQ